MNKSYLSGQDAEYLQAYLGICEELIRKEISHGTARRKLEELNARYSDIHYDVRRYELIVTDSSGVDYEDSWSSSMDCPWD